ncbi:MAG: invasion associated locus B family protein [Pseudomonadota bacterium]
MTYLHCIFLRCATSLPALAFALAFALFLTVSRPAAGQDIVPIPLAKHGVWAAYKYETQEEGPVCYAITTPIEEKGNYTRRGNVRLFVTSRPTTGSFPRRITIVAGYTHLNGSVVQASIGNQEFTLQVRGEISHTRDQQGNDGMLEAMKRGTNMTVVGRSTRSTLTTDTYSLIGLTRTVAAIDRACA